jgi:long-chain acyl-CoA synthetase
MMLYTSGTTGKPKGAMLSYENVFANAYLSAETLKINHDDIVIATLPMTHVFCLGGSLCAPILRGATVLVVLKFSPKNIFNLAENCKATILR